MATGPVNAAPGGFQRERGDEPADTFRSRFDAIEDLSGIRESKLDRSSGRKELSAQSCDFAVAIKGLVVLKTFSFFRKCVL